MKIHMPTGRTVINPFAKEPMKQAALATDAGEVAIASVDNSNEGVCPKCRSTMGTAIIPAAQVYYCTKCRVSAPIPESGE